MAIFIAFNSLVSWIEKNICGIECLATYVDDLSHCNLAGDTTYYEPYDKMLPCNQTTLLDLWDSLGIPHKEKKQVSGTPLPIIGISVDPNAMTLMLPIEAQQRLLEELAVWSTEPQKSEKSRKGSKLSKNSKKPVHFKLKHWQQMGGWVNYSFNVYPLLKPFLNNFYAKIKGKAKPDQRIYTNTAMHANFCWALAHIQASNSVHVLKSRSWKESEANCTFFCNASLEGMGFWDTSLNFGFYAPTSVFPDAPKDLIFHFEALCMLSALTHIHHNFREGHQIVIHTDSSNTFDIFNSLCCQPAYNHILKSAIDILITGLHDFRVLHVPGTQNTITNALSHFDFARAESAAPGISIQPFQPPHIALGPPKK